MKVWLITIGEPTPVDGNAPRLLRNGILANYLIAHNHKILWWNSTFDHTTKTHRFSKDKTVFINNDYQIRFLRSTGYSKNLSFARLVDHFYLGVKFFKQAPKYPRPDVILCSMPPILLPCAAVAYAKKYQVPIVIDLRDKWPDIFADAVPKQFRFIASPFLYPLKAALAWACKNATALTGMTDKFVEWGCHYAGREPGPKDISFPFGYKAEPPPVKEQNEAFNFWKNLGIQKDPGIFTICFFGAMANQVVFEPVCEAFKILSNKQVNVRLIFCGDGPRLEEFKSLAKDVPNIYFPGWVNKNQIWSLMRVSDAGLIPLSDDENFRSSFMNKSIEYISAGLPVICSVHGVLKDLLLSEKMGTVYDNNNPQELADTIATMFKSPDSMTRMRENTLRIFEKSYTEKQVYTDFTRFLEQTAHFK